MTLVVNRLFFASSLIRPALLALFAFIVPLLSGCNEAPHKPSSVSISGVTMGTRYNITLAGSESIDEQALKAELDKLLEDVNQSMSTYLPDSEISLLNASDEVVGYNLTEPLYQLIEQSLEISRASNGAFDISVGPLIELWGFGKRQTGDVVPSQALIDESLNSIGYSRILLTEDASSITMPPVYEISLSAIAKGYGVDRVAEYLLSQGHTNFLAEIGGEIRVAGNSPRGTPWRVAVEVPSSDSFQTVHEALELTNYAIATSGEYRNFFTAEGKRYSHTLDPRTGYPINHRLASVSVIHKSCALADGWATALNVMGETEGLALANRLGIVAYFIVQTENGFETVASDAYKALYPNR